MALLPIHNFFVFNGDLLPVSEFIPSENEGGIYEVLRVINGVPLFLEEHLERFYHSAGLANKSVHYTFAQIDSFLKLLIKENHILEGNILLSCKTNLKAFFIPHQYPTQQQYRSGVKCGILEAERENPNAKVFQTSVRKRANQMLEENGFFEVVLVDHFGRITEGSRSNIFFIKKNKIITPPAFEVLLGITRQKAILCAQDVGFEVLEEDVWLENLDLFDAAFITGTSPKILPINQIGETHFNSANQILLRLMDQFDLLIEEYIKAK